MIITINGEKAEAKKDSTIASVLKGRPYERGSSVVVIRSDSLVQRETSEFEIETSKGSMVLRLNESEFAAVFRSVVEELIGKAVRWRTSKVQAIGAFPTDLPVVRRSSPYSLYDCFFGLGGYDNRTSYLMISRADHEGEYGTDGGVFGRITIGRHVLRDLDEGDRIIAIKPVVLEFKAKDAFVTKDVKMKVEDGMVIESYVGVDLEKTSPVNCEHFLVVAEGGTMTVTDATSTYAACSTSTDVSLVPEAIAVREEGNVTVRHEGVGTGRIYFYKTRRQLSASHSRIGVIRHGMELIRLVPAGDVITIRSNPARVMSIGMTQKAAGDFLRGRGLVQVRKGGTGDGDIVVEQEPELTLEALSEAEVETFGVSPEEVAEMVLDDLSAPKTAHYVRKMTGLDHKPIGTLKVHFTYPDMPLVTFEGNPREAADLIPEGTFDKETKMGDVAVTNMSRPNRGLIGLRLDASEEFGPTGEERYGTNLVGRIVSDVGNIMKDLRDGDVIYVREVKAVKAAKGARRGRRK